MLASTVARMLPATRLYSLKSLLYRFAGAELERNVRLVSSARLVGSGRLVIGRDTFVGHDSIIISAGEEIIIGSCVDIGPRVTVTNGTHLVDMVGEHSAGAGYSKAIHIEDGVWIGCSVTVIAGVRIGRKAVIGAGSIVTSDVPPFTLAVGNPCRPIKQWDGTNWSPMTGATRGSSEPCC